MTSMVLRHSTLLESLTPSVNRPLVKELQPEEPRWFNQELKTQLQSNHQQKKASQKVSLGHSSYGWHKRRDKDSFPPKTIQASPETNSLPIISINLARAIGPSVNWLPN